MFCQDCFKKPQCKEICKELNDFLHLQGIYSDSYIRPSISSGKRRKERMNDIFMSKYKEIPFSSLKRDKDGEFDTSK